MNNLTKEKKMTLCFLFSTILATFLFYFRTIFIDIKSYDELSPFKEILFPIFSSLTEMFEFISLLGLNHHFEAMNNLYSNIVSFRCNPLGNFMQLFIQYLFKTNPVNYHIYSMSLHILSVGLIFLILNKVSTHFYNTTSLIRPLTVSLLTILWAIHPANIESVLLLTNANILLSHLICFFLFFLYINSFYKTHSLVPFSVIKSTIVFFLYLFSLFLAEFHFIFPLLLICYLVSMNIYINHQSNSFKNSFLASIKPAIKSILPLIIADLLFVFNFLILGTSINLHTTSLGMTLERIFWLSPQIIVHLLKLIFFPQKLSIDQSFLVYLSESYLNPYIIFCFVFLTVLLVYSSLSFINSNKKLPVFFISFFLLIVSLLPFSHIFAPLYNLASERYLYFPSFIIIFGIAHFVFNLLSQETLSKKKVYACILLLTTITTCSILRAYVRTLDWENSFTLYESSITTTNNPLYKAFRYIGLLPQNKIFERYPIKELDIKYQKLTIDNTKIAIQELKEKINKSNNPPKILRYYGLDAESLLIKAGFFLAQVNLSITDDFPGALSLIEPYTKDLSLLDSTGLKLYGSILIINNKYDDAEKVLRYAYNKYPLSTRIIYPLCDLIQAKYNDLNEIELLALKAFRYYPYDSFTLFILSKIYELKKDIKNFARFSYLYGLRSHSLVSFDNAYKGYQAINDKQNAFKAREKIEKLSL